MLYSASWNDAFDQGHWGQQKNELLHKTLSLSISKVQEKDAGA